jgi:hypothetical protein
MFCKKTNLRVLKEKSESNATRRNEGEEGLEIREKREKGKGTLH